MKFKTKIKSRIKEIREELEHMSQLELADRVGVSRQTIYFLEKGNYNPSLTLSFKISEVLQKPLNEIFYQEPIIRDIIGHKELNELEKIAENVNISLERLLKLKNVDDNTLSDLFKRNELENIAKNLGETFENLFEE
ncbi:MAG: helix-turn-helix transcriptional regulator [Candidatus Hermodarchaeota archaeon]